MRSSVASRIKLGIVLILVVLIAVLGMTGTLRIGKYRFYPFADFMQPAGSGRRRFGHLSAAERRRTGHAGAAGGHGERIARAP